MWAGTGNWGYRAFDDRAAAARRELERTMRAAERRRHRSLDKRARLLADMLAVLDKLKASSRLTARQVERMGEAKFTAQNDRWLRQYRRLNRALDSLA